MRLLVIRHAVAVDRDAFAQTGEPDALRPATAPGLKKMRQNVLGLRTIVPRVHVLASSPLVRARQTAELLQKPYALAEIEQLPALAPDRKPAEAVAWLAGLEPTSGDFTVAVVGHEPHLGQLVSFLLTGRRRAFVELRKGGACLLDLGEEVAPGAAMLRWMAGSRMLRAIGRGA
jgi:phosphohistidine phosphatase